MVKDAGMPAGLLKNYPLYTKGNFTIAQSEDPDNILFIEEPK